ncbi:hypothetical protein NYF23_03770 [SAR92 clade bacterium H455]|jgi:hypothetical protein|uniref:Uncharacterized protein n=1 Tax=SAR92 clade bacterium H455 TaxID=2974818 RepID=A0ABY5TPH2_9GAMM|nr:hypothetical protein NYF23_03770 [SAR92 clade bacterium H455]
MKMIASENLIILRELENAINQCCELLDKLSSTCCMPTRSDTMNRLLIDFNNFKYEINRLENKMDNIEAAINRVGDLGGTIGQLHVSCCTATREKLYQKILSSLNGIYIKLWRLKGVEH